MNSIRNFFRYTSLVLVGFVSTAIGCSKTNNVDLSGGDLPVGAECTEGPDDQCSGACFQGKCRALCGSNRECPVGQSCVADGARAVCAPASSLEFDLLTDCGDGCEVDLSSFGREGYFRLCELGGDYENGLPPSLASSESLDPRDLCLSTVGNAMAVKKDVLYGLDLFASRPTCAEEQRPIGVLGDTLVAHDCSSNEAGELVSSACTGRLMDAGGKTYLVIDPTCNDPYYTDDSSFYQLFEFSPETVDLPCNEAEAPTCVQPTFPPVGAAVSGFEGFWVECENADLDNLCLEPTTENASFALGNCQDLTYDVFRNSGFREYSAIYVRPDGYGMRWEGWPDAYYDSCNYAFRESTDGRVAVAGRAHAPVGTLEVDYEGWELVTTNEGETMLWRTNERVCYEANAGSFFKKVEVPADFDDRCEWGLPVFTF